MTFQPGQSGNPAGRAPGSRNKTTMAAETLLDGDAEAITRIAIERAKAGDMTAIRLCMDRFCPRPKDRPVAFRLPNLASAADAVAGMRSIVEALAAGDLTPMEAAELAKAVHAFAQTLTDAELDARVTSLEKKLAT
jgi:uncharacterized protein DUF5681